jgi:phosphatidate cytidylyltransferase
LSKLAKRVVVGAILGVVVGIALFVHPIAVFIISLIWITFATNEFLRMLEIKQIFINRFLMIGLNLLFPVIFYFGGRITLYLILPVVLFLYALIKRDKYYLVVPFGLFLLFYLGFLPAHLIFLKKLVWAQNFSLFRSFFIVFFPLIFTWVNDTAAYFIGSTIGRHKLATKISPNKTIEGFIGSILVSIIFSLIYLRTLFPAVTILTSVIMGLILSAAAQLGDLAESGFKRDVELKDSSKIFGEHGGFLDRIDSLLFTIPVFYYFLLYFAKISGLR